jgi:integrase
LQRPWRRIRESARLGHVRIHDLRLTYASNALVQGLYIAMVGKLLGHTQIKTTMRYVHLADAPVRDAAAQAASALEKTLKSASFPKAPPPRGDVVRFRVNAKSID